jgi:serine/threonine-protein kinase
MTDPTTRNCPTCGLAYPLEALFCPSDGTPLAPPPTPLIGRTLGGRYQVTKELGRGGMGHVYLATQLPMKRPCALKVIRPDRGWDPASVARFHREAENASRISHANVAQVYDSGEADGVAYLAMEYVDGEPLSALLQREGRLPPRRTARIVWQVANALGAAHHLGIVHRDLKPDNVMLTRFRDRVDFVKVVDFGIAKTAAAEGQQVTSASVVIGTPEYMSPEQFLGVPVDARSDVYALAILAIRMMAGTLPPVVGPKALMQPPGIPDPAGLAEMPETAAWPEPVKAALSRALARDAKDRTASVDEFFHQFATAVSRWEPAAGSPEPWEAAGDPQSAEVPRVTAPPPAPAGRRRLWVGLAALVVIAGGP